MSETLKNKVFISTRPEGQNGELTALLKEHGATLLEMPTIEIKAAKLSLDDEDLLEHISQFSWIVFTSPNGIRFFFKKLYDVNGTYDLPSAIKTAVVGRKTEKILNNFGYSPTVTNEGNTGAELAEKLSDMVKSDDAILFPEGSLARGVISEKLLPIADCTSVKVYENRLPQSINQEYLQRIIDKKYEAIILTSPSGFNNLISALDGKANLTDLKLVCIGSTTEAEVLEKTGLTPLATAPMSSAQGVVEAILALNQ